MHPFEIYKINVTSELNLRDQKPAGDEATVLTTRL